MRTRRGNDSFDRFLLRYLTFTGAFAAIVLIAPSLFLLGLVLFVLPGVFLGVMPTAFLWGAIFAAFSKPTIERVAREAGHSVVEQFSVHLHSPARQQAAG